MLYCDLKVCLISFYEKFIPGLTKNSKNIKLNKSSYNLCFFIVLNF